MIFITTRDVDKPGVLLESISSLLSIHFAQPGHPRGGNNQKVATGPGGWRSSWPKSAKKARPTFLW